MMDKIMDFCMVATAVILTAILGGVLIALIINCFKDEKRCAAYSEEITKTGFVFVGKVPIATKYKTRECLVWEEEK